MNRHGLPAPRALAAAALGAFGCARASSGGEVTFTVGDYPYPSFGPPGCSGDDTLKLRLSAAQADPSTLRYYVIKEDGTAWIIEATLSLYGGGGPICPDPQNVLRATAPVVGETEEQVIDLHVEPYDGLWELGEQKVFWVGKDEGGFASFRATSTVRVLRSCAR